MLALGGQHFNISGVKREGLHFQDMRVRLP